MTRRLAWLPLLALPLAVVVFAAPVPKPPGPGVAAFGTVVDPDKDCQFAADDGRLTISLPAAHHTLTTTPTSKNAPRVVRDVDGDFTATVRVEAKLPENPTSDLPGVDPGVAAGLVVWADSGNYVCLTRAHELLGAKRVSSAEFHYLEDGQEGGTSGAPAPLDTAGVFLRVTRQGARITGEISPDGKEWARVSATDLKAASRVRVGVFAENTAGRKVIAVFDKYEVKQSAGGTGK